MDNLDDHLIPNPPLTEDAYNLAWWEARRLYYNGFMLFLIALLMWHFYPMVQHFGMGWAIFWNILYLLVANVFYCLGYLLPLLLRFYFRTDFGLAAMASINFNLGLIISLVLTSFLYLVQFLPFR